MLSKKLSGAQIRQTFIDFYVERGHTIVPSSSLVPGGDATLLFTNAGMVQFKDVFLGTDKRPYKRAVDSQKCMRVAGKHNDLDDVGRDDTHHTFFEMLGNWSFGDYYKKEAIAWAWELLTEIWELPKERLYATVFEDDQGDIPSDKEAAAQWLAQPGFDSNHVYYMGRKDNFWEMADTGPCGPCSEIHYDLHPETGPVNKDILETVRFVELWNLVFIQYNRTGPDKLEPLPATHVDTGMGFERLVAILQEADSNYRTDLFVRSLNVLRSLSRHTVAEMDADFTPYRVISDHARAAAFLIADGVVPGNTGRNYVCRMIIRRAARFGSKIGLNEPFLGRVAEAVIDTYGSFYPELEKTRAAILDNLAREETRFARTVESGAAQLQNYLDNIRSAKVSTELLNNVPRVLEGRRAFELYATYGLPFEISRDIAREQGLEIDEAGFRLAMEEHRHASGGGRAMGALGGEDADFFAGILRDLQAKGKLGEQGVEYDPYTSLKVEGEVLTLTVDGTPVQTASFGDQVEVILPRTGFYVESGGQVDDNGFIRSLPAGAGKGTAGEVQAWEIEISGMRRPSAGVIVHVGEVISGQPRVGDTCLAEVDMQRRRDIMRNHTATHMLHAALHHVLGVHARQAGSLVAPDRLRFDFNHAQAMTSGQVESVERIVNEAVFSDMAVAPKLKSREDAIAEGAMALFGEKYGETVRTITIAPLITELPVDLAVAQPTSSVEQQEKYSYELCGGTHLDRTSEVGVFLILSEASAAAGVRRIEAVTGRGAYELIAQRMRTLKQVAAALRTSADSVMEKLQELQAEVQELRKERAVVQEKSAHSAFDGQLEKSKTVNGVTVLVVEVPNTTIETLRALSDRFRGMHPRESISLLVSDGAILSAVTEAVVERGVKAADLIAAMGGKGGGRPTMAQGRLPDTVATAEAFGKAESWLRKTLKPAAGDARAKKSRAK